MIEISRKGRIIIRSLMKDSFEDIYEFNEISLREVWDNKKDDVWDSYLKK